MRDVIHELSTVFFEKTGIEIESLEVEQEKESIFFLKLQTPDSALLIGNRGQTLYDFQRILSIFLTQKQDKKTIVRIEVNGYLEEKEKRLYHFIDEKIELCKTSGKDVILPFYSAYERKKIHNYISEKNLKNIATKSNGEGKERRLTIFKKQEKMTIDIDGTEI